MPLNNYADWQRSTVHGCPSSIQMIIYYTPSLCLHDMFAILKSILKMICYSHLQLKTTTISALRKISIISSKLYIVQIYNFIKSSEFQSNYMWKVDIFLVFFLIFIHPANENWTCIGCGRYIDQTTFHNWHKQIAKDVSGCSINPSMP